MASPIHNYSSMMAISNGCGGHLSLDWSSSCGDHDDDYDQCREREVSSVGGDDNSPMSRSGRKRAKKERRQKIKEGEVAEAFAAGSFLGKSCDDASMREILVRSVRTPGGLLPDTWASPILEPTKPTAKKDDTTTTTSARSKLRKGKRDLLRSWFATPKDEGATPAPEPLFNDQLPGPMINHHIDATRGDCRSPASEGSMMMSGSGYAPTAEGVFGGEEDEPYDDPNASLGSVASSTHSSISVRHSRPRDTIRSIQALRESSSTTFSNHLQLDDEDIDEHQGTIVNCQQHPQLFDIIVGDRVALIANPLNEVHYDDINSGHHNPSLGIESLFSICTSSSTRHASSGNASSPSTAASIPSDNNVSRGSFIPTQADTRPNSPPASSFQQQQDSSSFMMNGTNQPLQSLLGDTTTDLTTSLSSLQVSGLKVVKGSKKRHTVSFNGDVYNLATWDSEDLGPFVLTNSAALPPSQSHRDLQNSKGTNRGGSIDSYHSPPTWSNTYQSESQSSISVLASYFEQSQPQPQTTTAAVVTTNSASQFGSPLGDESPHSPLGRDVRPLSISLSTGNKNNNSKGDSSTNSSNKREGGSVLTENCSVIEGFQLHVPAGAMRRANSLFAEGHLSISSQSAFCTSSSIASARRNTADIPDHKCREYLSQLGANHLETSASSIQACSSVGPVGSNRSKTFDCSVRLSKGSPSSENLCRNRGPQPSFSDVVGRYVTVDTLVHKAISYTEQLANPASGTGHKKFRREQERWKSSSSSS